MPRLDTTHPCSEVKRVGHGGGEDISFFFFFRVSVAIRFHILIRSGQTRGKLGTGHGGAVGAKDSYEYEYHLALERGGGRRPSTARRDVRLYSAPGGGWDRLVLESHCRLAHSSTARGDSLLRGHGTRNASS